jgi:hypothetical protein
VDAFYNPEKDKLFEAVLGRSIVAWNDAEYQLRDLVTFLATDRRKIQSLGPVILVAEMGTWLLAKTIQTFADATLNNEDEKALVKHVATLFERLIPYRNHYVHGLIFVTDDNVGCIGGTTAKGQLKNIHGDVTIGEVGKFLDKVGELDDFLVEVIEFLEHPNSDERPALPEMREPIPPLAKETIILPLRPPSV